MSSLVQVTIHSSQFPDSVRRDLVQSLRSRQVNHKFHYDSVKQTQKWLELHQAYSPSRTDPDCAAVYDRGFEAAAREIESKQVHLIGMGCGGGQKDARLLNQLRDGGKEVFYTPSDVSAAMVLVARAAALGIIGEERVFPLVCDLASTGDWRSVFGSEPAPGAARLFTFFGMIPNFDSDVVLPALANLLRPGDRLLFSANLAPGPDYTAGIQRVLPLYDNKLTREWLLAFLVDLGVERHDGEIRFLIEAEPPGKGLKRIAAYFQFSRLRQIQVESEQFEFKSGEAIRLFFSYRHTPALISTLLDGHGVRVVEQWVTVSEEEGVFLVAKR
jgi:uncharacterized SAM-dependent methyltransferase